MSNHPTNQPSNHPLYQLTIYAAALDLVQKIDQWLTAGYHLRTTTGRLITTLDQAINAIQYNYLDHTCLPWSRDQ
jgi:hypothetical protein